MGKISSFTELAAAPATDDLFHVALQDVASKKTTWDTLKTYIEQYAGIELAVDNLSASDIANMRTTPIPLISGLSASEAPIILSVIIYYNYGTTSYNTSPASQLGVFTRQDFSTGVQLTNTSTFETGSDAIILLSPYWGATVRTDLMGSTYNQALLYCDTAPGSGDGVMEVQTLYQIIST